MPNQLIRVFSLFLFNQSICDNVAYPELETHQFGELELMVNNLSYQERNPGLYTHMYTEKRMKCVTITFSICK